MIDIYTFFAPFMVSLFGLVAKIVGLIKPSSKLVKTWEIRWANGQHAYRASDRTKLGKSPIWIHAASGEFEYAKPVIRTLVAAGETDIIVTYFSPTYAENVQKFPGVKLAAPLPFDRMDWMHDFVRWLRPRCLLISRTDTWPNMVRAAKELKCPSLLFSATFHEGSRRMGFLARSMTRESLSNLTAIQCVGPDDADLLKSIGCTNVSVCGDTRYDQVLYRLQHPKEIPPRLRSALQEKGKPVLVGGSLWREDLDALLEAAQDLDLSLVLVPHEPTPEHLIEFEKRLADFGYPKALRLSKLESGTGTIGTGRVVILVDRVGLLAELYTLGSMALVGGSFRGSVHSVMEPLAAGALTFVGPHYRNNREAIEFSNLKAGSLVQPVLTAEQLNAALDAAIKSLSAEQAEGIRSQVKSREGATASVAAWVQRIS